MADIDYAAMDEAASQAGEELLKLGEEATVSQVADWWRRWYLKAGHKRLAKNTDGGEIVEVSESVELTVPTKGVCNLHVITKIPPRLTDGKRHPVKVTVVGKREMKKLWRQHSAQQS